MDWRPGRGHGAQDTWLVAAGTTPAEDGTDDHLSQVGVLAFAHRIDAASLPNQAAHRRVFVPDVAELYLGNLSEGVVRGRVLREPEQGQFTDQFAGSGRPPNVEGEL